MKKNKLISLSVAAVTTMVLLSGVTYAWFVDQTDVAPVDVSTGTIKITGQALTGATNTLPGDKILLNNNASAITQAGSREAIVEISFEDQIVGTLAAGQTPTAALAGDYANGVFSDARIAQVVSLTMEPTATSSNFVEVDGKFYASLPIASGSTVTLGDVFLNIDGELGGNKMPGPSADRKFEMNSNFSVKYSATAVQNTKEAVVDVFGQDAANAIEAAGMFN